MCGLAFVTLPSRILLARLCPGQPAAGQVTVFAKVQTDCVVLQLYTLSRGEVPLESWNEIGGKMVAANI